MFSLIVHYSFHHKKINDIQKIHLKKGECQFAINLTGCVLIYKPENKNT